MHLLGKFTREGSAVSASSWLRVKRECVIPVGKNMPQIHSTKIRSLRPNVLPYVAVAFHM
jgi:hypothetical protein